MVRVGCQQFVGRQLPLPTFLPPSVSIRRLPRDRQAPGLPVGMLHTVFWVKCDSGEVCWYRHAAAKSSKRRGRGLILTWSLSPHRRSQPSVVTGLDDEDARRIVLLAPRFEQQRLVETGAEADIGQAALATRRQRPGQVVVGDADVVAVVDPGLEQRDPETEGFEQGREPTVQLVQ